MHIYIPTYQTRESKRERAREREQEREARERESKRESKRERERKQEREARESKREREREALIAKVLIYIILLLSTYFFPTGGCGEGIVFSNLGRYNVLHW